MQISKDELEELKEAFAKVGKSHLLLSPAHLNWIYPTAVISSSASRMWAFVLLSWLSLCQGVPWQLCCFWLVTLAKEHKGRDTGSVAIREHWQTALCSCSRVGCVASWWQKKYPNRYGIAVAWQHLRACTVLVSGGVGLADWLSHVHGQCRCCVSGLCRCILELVSRTKFVYLAIM